MLQILRKGRMTDLNKTRTERCMKEDVEAQLHLKMLEACCEENAEKLAKEETQAMEVATKGRRVRRADLTEKEGGDPGTANRERRGGAGRI